MLKIDQPLQIVIDDDIFRAHVGEKFSVALKTPLDAQRAFSVPYTPGVAQVSHAIAANRALAVCYTWVNRFRRKRWKRCNRVRVISDPRRCC
ncbi:hypothetical protein DIJ64_05805 [Mycobacterium leprae]|uniref:U1756w n=1 Tax=Mycobacterium leprae TaxID=1769 RepID=Q49980_MYCLR|nr:u1756w [Mycobacterium leprae]AWV47761.1 hypothetical protein DIJ64_05805 [Mycobacterium leprae]